MENPFAWGKEVVTVPRGAKSGWTKEVITLSMFNSQRGFYVEDRTAWVKRDWALFREPDGYWNVTHVPTGWRAGWFPNKDVALKAAACLEEIGLPLDRLCAVMWEFWYRPRVEKEATS